MQIIKHLTILLALFLVAVLIRNWKWTTYEYWQNGKMKEKHVSTLKGSHVWEKYSKDGKLVSVDQFLKDQRDGLCVQYYEDGTIMYKCFFKDGKPFNGIWPWPSNRINYAPYIHFGRFFKYTNGTEEEIKLEIKKFP